MVQISLFDFTAPPDPISGEAFTLSPLDAIILPVGAVLKTPISAFTKFVSNILKTPVSSSLKTVGLQAARARSTTSTIFPTVSP